MIGKVGVMTAAELVSVRGLVRPAAPALRGVAVDMPVRGDHTADESELAKVRTGSAPPLVAVVVLRMEHVCGDGGREPVQHQRVFMRGVVSRRTRLRDPR